ERSCAGMARAPHRVTRETRREPRTPDPRREPDEPARPHLAKGTRDDIGEAALKATRAGRGSRAIDDDIAAVAHDVRTPLSIIMLETNVLEDRLGKALTSAVRHSLERITLNAAYIDRLVSDLLDLGSHDAGRLELRRELVALEVLLARALERAVATVERK